MGILDELIKINPTAKKVYKFNPSRCTQTAKKARTYNDSFSETFFVSWISNVLLKYAFLISKNDEKLKKFEEFHLFDKRRKKWKSDLELYKYFKSVKVDFVDLLEFVHTKKNDIIRLRICVVCSGKIEAQKEIEKKIYYYEVELIKNNESKIDYTDLHTNCPNCGAPNKIDTFGTCSYCSEIISIYDNIWKIRNIELKI